MQQETPQVNQPSPQLPPVSGAPVPPTPPDSGKNGADFYQPAKPATYTPAEGHTQPPAPSTPRRPATGGFSWEASEYIHMEKGAAWLVALGVVVLAAVGVAVWFAAWTFAILILVMGVALGVFAFRKPHTVHYALSADGITAGDKLFRYEDFRAFGVLEDGAFFTMTLIPVKRFAPAVNIYFSEEQGEDIVDIMSDHLPMEQVQPDLIDTIMRRLRF